jgi:hypothetical protein
LFVLSDGLTRPAPSQYHELISKAHNSLVGHEGVEATIDKLSRAHIKWKHMRRDVKQFIKNCPTCQKAYQQKLLFESKPFTLSGTYPMQDISMDSITDFTADKYGNKHILVIIDNFSRFVELYPIPDLTAERAANCLCTFIGRYGAPATIRSDGGTQFINAVISNLALLVSAETIKSVAYSHEENSLVERANKEIMRHLRNIIFDYRVAKKWSTYLPSVQRVINSTKHLSTGVTPAEIVFGNSINLDRGLFYETSNVYVRQSIPQRKTMSRWMADAIKAQAHRHSTKTS